MRSWYHDPLWVLASFGAVLALLGIARWGRAWSPDARRRFLHIGVGSWVLFVTPRFDHLLWALVPPAAFLYANASGRLRSIDPDLASDPAAARGLWTFPLGVGLAYVFFWEDPARASLLAGVAALTFADPAAAWVGRRWGQRRYRGFGFGRSVEGSLAFLVVALAATAWIASGAPTDHLPVRIVVGAAAAGALAEAVTPPGWDNVTIPIVVAAVFGVLF
ncbi:MAG TPA: hypothetical protein VLT84_07200 [Acidobacteriota bacterium]|nr:hypothetical protein [Acidobacteriota bacterium]